ncbi:YgeY family selenium metabolism-linked hydrolase [Candidatus Formimonas warabiya]|uniref:YgeY family selenium metabolism-linked hydrolase n=1 Tax=Formimonas warabiya TaxID=1761012 RepID=UPI001BE40602|nr:YgeY family selenium metabolism-linked hydrolase [Candidatus Formimonas warabiya]
MTDLRVFAEKIGDYLEKEQDHLVQFLRDFIAIPSETYNEREAANFFADKMRANGFDEVKQDRIGNVFGRIGSGKTVILYDAHMDTVEAGELSAWRFDPFKGKLENGIVYGRGAVDDKGCLAAFVYAGKALKELGLDQDFTLYVVGAIAEEDVEGSALEDLMESEPQIKPDYVLIGESSEMRITRGHKGRALLQINVPGKAAHASAAHLGENSLIKAIPVIQLLDAWKDLPEDPFLGKGTLEVTKVACKTPSLNTIPGETVIYIDRRTTAGETKEDLLNEVRPLVEKIGATVKIVEVENPSYTGYVKHAEEFFPSWVIPEDHELVQAGARSFKTLFDKDPIIGKWNFSTDGTQTCGRAGIPTIGFGPGNGAFCHSTDDQVPISELVDAAKFYALLPLAITNK